MDRAEMAELEVLGERITELAAHISAAQYRWLRLVAEFDARGGWAPWGCRSTAHWLNWRCGLDLRSAREKVRVARALGSLPLVCAAFERGELSYAKVRAISRIATPETEAELVSLARHGTASHVEKVVAGYRRSVPPVSLAHAELRFRERFVKWNIEWDGSMVFEGRVPPESAAIVVAALRAAAAAGGSAEPPADAEPFQAEGSGQRYADALVAVAEGFLSGSASATGYEVVVHVDAAALCDQEHSERCSTDDGVALASETARRIACDAGLVPVVEDAERMPLDVGRRSRTIPVSMKRALRLRDRGCRFPNCTNTAFVDGHHIVHWADGGSTALSNLVLLCRSHHRDIHEGGFSVERLGDGFVFRRPDGRTLETVPFVVEPGGVVSQNEGLGLKIDASTAVAKWGGERCDYGIAVMCLLQRNGLLYPPRELGAVPRNREIDVTPSTRAG